MSNRRAGADIRSEPQQLQEIGALLSQPIGKPDADDCIRIKDLGYRSSHCIQMYGERFDVVSDPFADGNGVAVQVTTAREPKVRKLRLPTSILLGLRGLVPKANKPT